MQAIPVVASGAADAFAFDDRALALCCASHSGEPEHAALAADMLARAGLGVSDLECGAHPPMNDSAARALVKAGVGPTALHNNCSGKHAGMLATARHLGWPTAGYVQPDHPVQRRIAGVLRELVGTQMDAAPCGVDGCSVPTWALPIEALARAYARIASGEGSELTLIGHRLLEAGTREPFHVAGSGRLCTRLMRNLAGRAFVKTGAEGVYCAALPAAGIGIALKIDDGAGRAAEIAIAAVLAALFPDAATAIKGLVRRPLTNVRGKRIGELRPAADLRRGLDALRPV